MLNACKDVKIKMAQTKIPEIIIKIVEEKSDKGKKNINVDGLNFINPLYEALVGVFRKNIPAGSIVNRFARDETSLRQTIATETLLDFLSTAQKTEIAGIYNSGAPLEQITKRAALYISEGSRTRDGRVLTNVASEVKANKYLIDAIRLNQPPIYLESASMPELKKTAKIMKRNNRIKITSAMGLIGLLTMAVFYSGHKKYEELTRQGMTNRQLTSSYSNLVEKVEQEKKKVSDLEERYTKNQEYLQEQAKLYDKKQKEILELGLKIANLKPKTSFE